jgi:Ig-like domain CHU_C associated
VCEALGRARPEGFKKSETGGVAAPSGTANGTYGLKVTFGTRNTSVVLVVQNFVLGTRTGSGTGPLTITGAPLSVTIPSGEPTQLRVPATGSGVLSYQWYLGQSGSTAIPISGANRSIFTTPSLTANTPYWVLVTDGNGLAVISQTASVTVAAISPITVTQELLNPAY